MNDRAANLLKKHQLRKTGMRIRVLEIFLDSDKRALTHPELERLLPNADRITLYRTLKAFEEKGLIHQVVDGGNASKYALCHDACTAHEHHDQHAHFHCQGCGKTICLDEVTTSRIPVPVGFVIKQTHLVLEGICDFCSD